MIRFCILALLCTAFTGILFAAEQYRMTLRNESGQISIPDDPGKKTYFIDLAKAGAEPPQFFGGKSGDRFKALRYDAVSKILYCVEVATNKPFALEVGKQVNFPEIKP